MKKRMICIALACVMLMGILTACGDKKQSSEEAETAATEATELTEELTTEEITTEAPETEAETEEETEAATEALKQGSSSQSSSQSSSSSQTPAATKATEASTEPPASEPTEAIDKRSVAMGYIGSSVGSLYAAIGYPNSSSYASGCNGPGEDGELYYDGFTVYTYRENGVETVTDVW